ncbi:MAG: hypothetical protein WKF73_15165 [Nocardioidaceae bacterium]
MFERLAAAGIADLGSDAEWRARRRSASVADVVRGITPSPQRRRLLDRYR